jgi:hypothetical protein
MAFPGDIAEVLMDKYAAIYAWDSSGNCPSHTRFLRHKLAVWIGASENSV